jgi:signal transduction histidine kinase
VSNRERLHGLTIRAALLLGFGVTLAVWLISGYSFSWRMSEVQREAGAINARYMHAQELLSTVRAQVLLGSVYVRDALLDPNPGATDEYRHHVEETFASAENALEQYVPALHDGVENGRIRELQHEIAQFRATTLEVLASDSTRWPSEARTLLRSRIVPKREGVFRVSEEVQALNRTTFVEQQSATAEVYEAMQRRIWVQLGLALVASFIIGLFATRHVSRLEERLKDQRAREGENTRNLQRLSAQLITVQEAERRTIARELHDEVGQVLTALKVELAVAQRTIDAAGDSRNVLAGARALTDGALHTVRDLSQLLRPAVLDDLGLPAAIGSHLRDFSRRHNIRAELLQSRMEERLMPETEAAAYRIVQEALTNVARHAQATSCRVYLQRLAHTVLLTVEDDGVGFDVERLADEGRPSGVGLLGIRERVTQLDGTIRLESTRGNGTRLTVELPVGTRDGQETADPPPSNQMTPLEVLHG